MRNERNVELSRRWFAEVWNANRLEAVDELLAPDVIIHGLGEDGGDLVGSHHFKAFQRNFASAFPDLHIAVDDVMSEGDQTVVRMSFTATHSGDGLGIPRCFSTRGSSLPEAIPSQILSAISGPYDDPRLPDGIHGGRRLMHC